MSAPDTKSKSECCYCGKEPGKEEVIKLNCGHTVHINCIKCHKPTTATSTPLSDWMETMARPPLSVDDQTVAEMKIRIANATNGNPPRVPYRLDGSVHTIRPLR